MKATRPSRRLRQAFAIGLLLVIGAVFWLTNQKAPDQMVQLPNGGTFTLQEATYGKTHIVLEGDDWKKHLIRFTPPFLKSETGGAGLRYQQSKLADGRRILLTSPTEKTLAIWTQYEGPGDFWTRPLRFAVRNEDGETYECAGPKSFGRNPGKSLILWELTAFPRRGKEVTLEIFSEDSDGAERKAPIASVTVPNPDPGPHPEWPVKPLPQTNQIDQLTVVLADLLIDQNRFHHAGQNFSGGIAPVFNIFENGKPTSDWQCEYITFSDATGNTWGKRPANPYVNEPLLRAGLHGVFGQQERPWKIATTLYRTGNFGPETVWDIEPLPLGEITATNVVTRTRRQGKVHLTLRAQPATRFSHGSRAASAVEIRVQADGLPSDHILVLHNVKDDARRTIRIGFSMKKLDSGEFIWTLTPAYDAKLLDFQLAITPLQRARVTFEFIANPRVLQP